MAKEIQDWNLVGGAITDEDALILPTSRVSEIPDRLKDLQAAIRNYSYDTWSFRQITTIKTTGGETHYDLGIEGDYSFLDRGSDKYPTYATTFSCKLNGSAAKIRLQSVRDDTTVNSDIMDLYWSDGERVRNDELKENDEVFITSFELPGETATHDGRKLHKGMYVRKVENRSPRTLSPKVKIFTSAEANSLFTKQNATTWIMKPSHVSSETITRWAIFCVGGQGAYMRATFGETALEKLARAAKDDFIRFIQSYEIESGGVTRRINNASNWPQGQSFAVSTGAGVDASSPDLNASSVLGYIQGSPYRYIFNNGVLQGGDLAAELPIDYYITRRTAANNGLIMKDMPIVPAITNRASDDLFSGASAGDMLITTPDVEDIYFTQLSPITNNISFLSGGYSANYRALLTALLIFTTPFLGPAIYEITELMHANGANGAIMVFYWN